MPRLSLDEKCRRAAARGEVAVVVEFSTGKVRSVCKWCEGPCPAPHPRGRPKRYCNYRCERMQRSADHNRRRHQLRAAGATREQCIRGVDSDRMCELVLAEMRAETQR